MKYFNNFQGFEQTYINDLLEYTQEERQDIYAIWVDSADIDEAILMYENN